VPARYRSFILLHLIVFIWGWTAILGKLITISSTSLVWYRILIAVGGIIIYLKAIKVPLRTNARSLAKFFGVGLIIALHWVFFYEAIKVSTVSVTLACFSSGTLFASFLEPLLFRRRIVPLEIIFGIIVIAGIYLIFRFESKYGLGIIYSLSAAFLSSLFTVFNGILVRDHDSKIISFYELLGGFTGLTLFLLLSGSFTPEFFNVSPRDWLYLVILALVCTAFAFIVSVEIMKEINPFTVVLTVNLEPIYGIILAYFIFGEEEKMTLGFYIGSIVILATIFTNAAIKKYISK
jgi:drug/metabolite transporter (DMT)-like permease